MIKVGVIGVGHLGQHHARIYSIMPRAELIGVFDTDADRAREIAGKYGTKAFDSIEELVSSGVEAVSIAVPTTYHFEVARKCLDAGVNVLVEKPFTKTVAEAEELIELAQSKGLIIQVGHIERFNPAVSFIKSKVAEPKFIEVHRLAPFKGRSMDIGVVLDLAVHDLDVLLHIVGSDVESLDAVGVNVLSATEDIANIRIKYKNGCVANVTTSRVSQEEMRKIRVFSDSAYLSLDYKQQEGYIIRKEGFSLVKEEIPIEKGEPLKLELDAFVECVAGRIEKPFVSGEHGKEVLEMALEITRMINS